MIIVSSNPEVDHVRRGILGSEVIGQADERRDIGAGHVAALHETAAMQAIIYSTKSFEVEYLQRAAVRAGIRLQCAADAFSASTAGLARGYDAAVIFTGDDASAAALEALAAAGVHHLATRAAGYDNIDLATAHRLGIRVAHVPDYSPEAIAEHALALMLALSRKLIRSDRQVHAYNFDLSQLVGRNISGRTVGIIGTGKIGGKLAGILEGFGCRLLGFDKAPDPLLEQRYALTYRSLPELCRDADIITIHAGLNPGTRHLINADALRLMKRDAMLINTGRGGVVDTVAVVDALERGELGGFGADVYEGENGLFFYDRSASVPDDPVLRRLLQLPNVLLTPHQAFATAEALTSIAETTCRNLLDWDAKRTCDNEL